MEETDSSPETAPTPWYAFESLTYIPFDNRLIDRNRLTDDQLKWLEQYNQAIVEKLGPTLSPEEIAWLTQVCSA
jgi:Xaa-Pro aminopeptidase